MSKKLDKVLIGFLNLKEEDKKELLKLIKGYKDYPFTTQEKVEEAVMDSVSMEKFKQESVNLGPSPGGCPCCGK